jgi:hypothetical protein
MPLSLAGAIIVSPTQGQSDPGVSANFVSSVGIPLPNVGLPPQVVAPEGKLTLFADFAHATELACPVYLVNRTGKPLTLTDQGGSLFLKLFHAREHGSWQRAQAHIYSNCGNSFRFPSQLQPGNYVKTSGYISARGRMGKIRYQLFDTEEGAIVSNDGTGRWNPQDVTDSLNDEMSALDEIPEPDAIREIHAIPLIADPSQRREVMENGLACLDLIGRGPNRGRLRQGLQSLKAVLDPSDYDKSQFYWPAVLLPPETLDQAKARMQEIANRPAADPSPAAFIQVCLGLIRSPDHSVNPGFGSPKNRPWIVWEVLEKLAVTRDAAKEPTPKEWKEVFELAEARVHTAGNREKIALAKLFWCHALMAEHVHTRVLLANVKSDSPQLSEACIAGLHYRQAYSNIAKLGLDADIPLKRRILHFFCMAPSAPDDIPKFRLELLEEPNDSVQRKFLESCVKADLWASFLAVGFGLSSTTEMGIWLSKTYQEAFDRLLETSENGVFPVSEPTQFAGLRDYLGLISKNPEQRTIQLLKRVVRLAKTSPPGEPDASAKARDTLVRFAGRELRMEEYYR